MSGEHLILEINDLKLSFLGPGNEKKTIVEGLNLHVAAGKVTGLIGESGCGKSLTCLAAMDLLPKNIVHDGGGIRLDGNSKADIPAAGWRCYRGRRAAMVLQNPMSCFDPVFTVGRHIRETLAAHGVHGGPSFSRVHAVLSDLGFDNTADLLSAYPFQLSGGMLQRIMIALALLLEARLLIADEPTSDLDVIVQGRILQLIDRLRREKQVGVLLVTHDLSVIARLADQVSVMRHGRIVETGPVAGIFENPRHRYTRQLLAAHFSLYRHHQSKSLPEAIHDAA